MWPAILATVPIAVVTAHFARQWLRARRLTKVRRAATWLALTTVIPDVEEITSGTVGVTTWNGRWNGHRVQIRTIIDTLVTRKLPTLWLSVTLQEPVAIPATFDMMMRPASATTFSNFDQLNHTVELPAQYPAESAIRTNDATARLPMTVIGQHLEIFSDGRAKELLVTPNGVRIVWMLAEADRLRYGVLRQADFSGARLEAVLIDVLLNAASALRADINRQSIGLAA